MHPYVSLLNTCMRALHESDYATVKRLFAPGGKVLSSFLGEMMNLFSFDPASGRVTCLDLIYDTHPIRASAGNKYQL